MYTPLVVTVGQVLHKANWLIYKEKGSLSNNIRYGVMANIAVSHTAARGSIPRIGITFLLLTLSK